jgi:hypothetical protein
MLEFCVGGGGVPANLMSIIVFVLVPLFLGVALCMYKRVRNKKRQLRELHRQDMHAADRTPSNLVIPVAVPNVSLILEGDSSVTGADGSGGDGGGDGGGGDGGGGGGGGGGGDGDGGPSASMYGDKMPEGDGGGGETKGSHAETLIDMAGVGGEDDGRGLHGGPRGNGQRGGIGGIGGIGGLAEKEHRVDFTFKDLGLVLNKGSKATVLAGVTGSILSGRVTAVMGPSGAGKSTFVTTLAGKASYGRQVGRERIRDVHTVCCVLCVVCCVLCVVCCVL